MNRYTLFTIISLVALVTGANAMEIDRVITKQEALERAKAITDNSLIGIALKNKAYETFRDCLGKIKQETFSEAMISKCMQELSQACRSLELLEKQPLGVPELTEVLVSIPEVITQGSMAHRESISDRYLPLLEKTAANLEKILEIKQNKIKNAPGFFRRNIPVFLVTAVIMGTLAGWSNFGLGVAKAVAQAPVNGTLF